MYIIKDIIFLLYFIIIFFCIRYIFCYLKHSIDSKDLVRLACCKSCPFIFARESRRCIECPGSESPFPSPLLRPSSSAFPASEPRCVWPDGIFPLYFPSPVCTLSNSIVPALIPSRAPALYFTCTFVSSSFTWLAGCPLSRAYTVYSGRTVQKIIRKMRKNITKMPWLKDIFYLNNKKRY